MNLIINAAIAVITMFFVSVVSFSPEVDAYGFAPTRQLRSPVSHQLRHAAQVSQLSSEIRIHRRRDDGSPVTLHLFPSSPLESAANFLPSRKRRSISPLVQETQLPAMSQSVFATCSTLPEISTAHGLLSPEVVMRIADHHDLDQDCALHRFLSTYRSHGPMACLPMLGDPSVLPELTRAMRDIV